MRWTRASAGLWLTCALGLAACANPGQAPVQRSLAAAATPPGGATFSSTTWPAADWWHRYGDAELDRLIDLALAGQPNLEIVQARRRRAVAVTQGALAAQAPQALASGDAGLQRFSEHGNVSPTLAGDTRLLTNLQVQGSWEWDLFGRQNTALAAALGQQRAAEAELQATRVLLATQVASAYFTLARLCEQQALAEHVQRQRREAFKLIEQRVAADLDSAVELHDAESLVVQAGIELSTWAEPLARARHALAELAGLAPTALNKLTPRLASRPVAPTAATPPGRAQGPGPGGAPSAVPSTLPADLLGRRADLVALRWRVEAALRDVDLAQAKFYPSINLVAFVGLNSIGLDHWLDWGSRSTGVGPALRLPLFDGGRLRALRDARSAEADAAIETYNAALLRALREVADELASLSALQGEVAAQAELTRVSQASLRLAQARRDAGVANVLPVLQAQSVLLSQQRRDIDLRARHLLSEMALTRALGGGYQSDAWMAPAAAAGSPAPKP